MKLAVDENIALGKEAFSLFGEVRLFNGRNVKARDIKDCEILIVRSVTPVNAELLENTAVRFVGTATIGTDHIDTEYLETKGIAFASAPGSNAFSVAEYVFAGLLRLSEKYGFNLRRKSIGIIGYGNVGGKVGMFAEALGMNVIKNDPPLEDAGQTGFSALEDALRCDIVTFHTPLIKSGKYKTFHLLDERKMSRLKDEVILINTSRGAVVDNSALVEFAEKKKIRLIMDVWENEPNINAELAELAEFATPHIAGYSVDGKINGTKMIFDALNKFLNSGKKWNFGNNPSPQKIDCRECNSTEEVLASVFKVAYPIDEDSEKFKQALFSEEGIAKKFDLMRKNYRIRYELNHYQAIITEKINSAPLQNFRLQIERV